MTQTMGLIFFEPCCEASEMALRLAGAMAVAADLKSLVAFIVALFQLVLILVLVVGRFKTLCCFLFPLALRLDL
jgi:hypothetical protein